jgi:hypothetical protein
MRLRCGITWISFIFTTLGAISSAITIIYFSVKLGSLSDYDYVYEYHETTCTPMMGYALQLNCTPTKWISVWETDEQIAIVENPFALRKTRTAAIDDRQSYVSNRTYDCMCRNAPPMQLAQGCQFWSTCIFDVEFIQYIQRDNDRYIRTHVSFIAASCVAIILTGLALPFTIKDLMRHNSEYVEMI